jgi:hypothetical protein
MKLDIVSLFPGATPPLQFPFEPKRLHPALQQRAL